MLNLSWNLFLKIFQNLNITSHEFKFVLGTHLLLQQGTSKNKADVVIFFFSTHFQKLKRFAHFIRLILLHTCKNKFQWQPFSAKRIYCKGRSSKLYFSKGIQNNPPRSNFHCYSYHKCYLRKPKSNIIITEI